VAASPHPARERREALPFPLMARNETVEHLASVPLFSECSKKDLQKVGRSAEEIEVPAGKLVVDQGRVGQEFFLILDGTATVRRNDEIIAELGPGSYFGELALLLKEPRNASVVADTDMKVLVLHQRTFSELLDGTPGFAHKLLSAMARRLRDADARGARQ
jgi:CRP/FNR family transcriptional regulator, cyclic AMP receptor protein